MTSWLEFLWLHISLVGTGTGHLFLPSQAWSQGFQEPFHEYLEKKAVGCLCGLYFSKLDFAQSLHAAKAVLILPMLYEGCSYTVTNGQCWWHWSWHCLLPQHIIADSPIAPWCAATVSPASTDIDTISLLLAGLIISSSWYSVKETKAQLGDKCFTVLGNISSKRSDSFWAELGQLRSLCVSLCSSSKLQRNRRKKVRQGQDL